MKRVAANARARSARRGITILEVMIVVTGATVMLGLCAVTIQLLMKLSADVQGRYGAAVSLDRLARQLRADAHSSESAEVAVDDKAQRTPTSLRLVFEPGHIVAYQPDGTSVIRTESQAGKMVRHESYALPRGGVARFELRDLAAHRLVALVVAGSTGKSQTEPPRPWEVVALQGKDRVAPPRKQGGKPR